MTDLTKSEIKLEGNDANLQHEFLVGMSLEKCIYFNRSHACVSCECYAVRVDSTKMVKKNQN